MGRDADRITVEEAYRLDMAALRRLGFLRPGVEEARLSLTWAAPWGEPETARVVIDRRERPSITLRFDQGEQSIALESTAQGFGGKRWWLVCPITRRRCRALYRPLGADRFASREAYRLIYRSQQLGVEGRVQQKLRKLSEALGADEFADQIDRPKGMHRATFHRKKAARDSAAEVADRLLLAWLSGL